MASQLRRFLRKRRLTGAVTITMSVGTGILSGMLTNSPSVGVAICLAVAVAVWVVLDRLLSAGQRSRTTSVKQTAVGGTIDGTTINAAGGARVTEATTGGEITGGTVRAEGGIVSRRADAGGRLQDADVNVTDDDTLP